MSGTALNGRKYSAYPEYKESGIKWFESVPKHWIATELKRYSNVTDGSHHSPSIQSEGYPFISVTDVGENEIDFINCKRITKTDYLRLVKEGCKPKVGDLLLTKDGTIGRATIVKESDQDFVILSSLGLLSPSNSLNDGFLYYFLVSGMNVDQMNSMIHGSALKRMTIRKIDNLKITFPAINEQQKIANFLDHETAKIDTLIAKQEKLIELLKEKRQAVISHAVTRGLNPDATMKDSGVEWLGEVPEHWVVKKLKFCSTLLSQKETINVQTVIALENIEGFTGRFISTNSKYSGEDVSFSKGDILFGKLRPYLAKVFLCDNTGVAFGDILAFRPNNQASSNFLFYTMISEWFIEIVNSSTYGSKMPRASSDFINEMEIAFPPIDEQIKIAQELDTMLGKFEILTKKAVAAIVLMKERKTALISAAVTGKIDVRNYDAEKAGN
ncbi:MAG: restriction endonuclease subunit S [Colwellia sp.]